MGYMKKIQEDYDLCFDQIDELMSFLLERETATPDLLKTLQLLRIELDQCMEKSDANAPHIVLQYMRNIFKKISVTDNTKIENILNRIRIQLILCLRKLRSLNSNQSAVFNSENFYTERINASNQKIEELSQEIERLRKEKSTLSTDKNTLKEKEAELQRFKIIVEKYRNKEDELKLREDAITNWKKKINESFEELDNHIKPIKDEHKRLCRSFWTYNVLSSIIVTLLLSIEIILIKKLCNFTEIPPLINYLTLIVPIPVAVGLLWGSITQANRAQRQLVVLSKFIHDIKYTEGILLSINNLATDASDSAKRINNALDKLLDKHLSCNLDYIEETSLKNEEKKDTIPYELLINVIKELKK